VEGYDHIYANKYEWLVIVLFFLEEKNFDGGWNGLNGY